LPNSSRSIPRDAHPARIGDAIRTDIAGAAGYRPRFGIMVRGRHPRAAI
jgi:ribonucleotide monophosphatase NagD (HAD superfamily)